MIRVALIDDHKSIIELLAEWMVDLKGIQVINSGYKPTEFMEDTNWLDIDVLLTDYRMNPNGVVVAKHARSINPAIRIVFWSGYSTQFYIQIMRDHDLVINGFLKKSDSVQSIGKKIEEAFALKATEPCPKIQKAIEVIQQKKGTLSTAQIEILSAIARGTSKEEIAVLRCSSYDTVHSAVKQIYLKLDVHDKAEAVAKGIEWGYLPIKY